jgi:hypothetical protein
VAFANTNYSDVAATTIENRSKSLADNVTRNNALLTRLEERGNVKPFSGGTKIIQELSFQENGNAGWYSGYDPLPVGAADVISAAEFEIKQAAVSVVMSGLEMLQNNSREQMIDLLEGRVGVAEATIQNLVAGGIYSDGTAAGGKQIVGLNAAVEATATASQTATYGGISRTTWAFWRSYYVNSAAQSIVKTMNTAWASLVRGSDRVDLIVSDANSWNKFVDKLQTLQRLTNPKMASLGFPSQDFMGADVVLDGGIGGFCPSDTMFFLNTKYLFYRPHRDRNMVPLSPNKRYATNQDAEIQLIGWAGNMACSGAQFQGRIGTASAT